MTGNRRRSVARGSNERFGTAFSVKKLQNCDRSLRLSLRARGPMTANEQVPHEALENAPLGNDRWSMPLFEQVRAAVQAWAQKQPDKPSLSKAIERLIETGVTD
jgi:hypothetical protein